jgi:Tol biopolymer transport system component
MKTPALPVAVLVLLGFAGAGHAAAGGGSKIVFQSNRDGNNEIYTMNADGTNRVDLTRNSADDIQPRWSPDGSQIVFVSDRAGADDIFTMNADGTHVQQVTTTDSADRRPSWTSDGRIVFVRGPFGSRIIDVVNADGSGLTPLTSAPTDSTAPAPSPHGGRIAFSSTVGGTQSLYVMNAKGGAVQQLTQPPTGYSDFQANWSPHGNVLVFVRADPNGGTELYLVNTDGTELHRLTSTPNRVELEPSWSPDATQIVFHGCSGSGDTQHCALYVINADGTGETEISTPRTPYLDTFSSDRIDPFWGIPFITGSGVSINETNGELEVSVPSAAQVDPSFGYISLGVSAQCRLVGDFDVQADYRLLDWPVPSDVNLSLDTFPPDFSEVHGLFVFNPGFGTGISTHFPGTTNTFVQDPATSGALRLQRVGATLTAYYMTENGWAPLQSTTESLADQLVNLNVFSNVPPFSHPDVKVAYDNFQVSSGTFACPSWWDDGAPDWQAG